MEMPHLLLLFLRGQPKNTLTAKIVAFRPEQPKWDESPLHDYCVQGRQQVNIVLRDYNTKLTDFALARLSVSLSQCREKFETKSIVGERERAKYEPVLHYTAVSISGAP